MENSMHGGDLPHGQESHLPQAYEQFAPFLVAYRHPNLYIGGKPAMFVSKTLEQVELQ
jgi:hypothetical protein